MGTLNPLVSGGLNKYAITVLLASMALLGNALSVSLFYGVDLIFGSIFVFIAISYLGALPSIAVAAAGGLYTWILWDHPYAAIIFAAEGAVVYWLNRRADKSLLLADGLFWVCLGMPLVVFFYSQGMKLSLESSAMIAVKQCINGIFNVLIASVLIFLLRVARGKMSALYLGNLQIRSILFHSMLVLTLAAGTLPIIQYGKIEQRNSESLLVAELSGLLDHLATDIEESKRQPDDVLEKFVSRSKIDQSLSFAILDQSGSVIASKGSPWISDGGVRRLGSWPNGELQFLDPKEDLSAMQTWREGRYQMIQAVGQERKLSVVVQAPAAPVAAKMTHNSFKFVLLLGVLLVLGILISQILSRLLAMPMWRLSTALNSSTNGIVITDLTGRVEWLNEGFTRVSGYSITEMYGKKPGTVLQGVGTDQQTVARIRGALAERRPFEEEILNYDKDGLPYWVRINCEPLRCEDGRLKGFIAVETDVTEQKQTSEFEQFGSEALEKIAQNCRLEEIYRTIIISVESIIPVRCVIELGGPGFESNRYFPAASYLDSRKGSIASLEQNRYRAIPMVNSEGEKMGTLRIWRRSEGHSSVRDHELVERASQIIAIATERFRSDRKLQETASVFRHANEGIFITDPEFLILDVNAAFTTITGYQKEEAVGYSPEVFYEAPNVAFPTREVWNTLDRFGQWQGEMSLTNQQGEFVHISQSVSVIRGEEGEIRRYVFLINDITELKDYQRQLESMAKYDALTKLPNRVLLGDRLQQAMRQVERNQQRLAVLFIDLDGFKQINDSMGHTVGDQLLKSVTSRVSRELRDTDTFARFGGDEFVVVLPELEEGETVENVASRILSAVAEKELLAGCEIGITASIGLSFYPQSEKLDADQLLRQADQAMYTAKQRGRNCFQYFDTENDKAVREFHEDLSEITVALEEQEFVLFYQPKVNLKTGEIVGAEALIRWQHPERGLVPPNDFLPIIEQHALSVDVGEWVLNSALSQMHQWRQQGLHIPVSVNINPFHLRQGNFASRLNEILELHPSVPAGDLELEIVETSSLENLGSISEIINDCRRLGVVFSLDDFGTGYSSLSYLRRLPVERLKIDMSFVRDMLRNPDDFAIVEGILGLAKSFGLAVVAEGVETSRHSKELMKLGCDFGQGYGIAKPMPGTAIPEWIKQRRIAASAGCSAENGDAVK